MPFYEFVCDSCGHRADWRGSYEAVQTVELSCPFCLDTAGHAVQMRRAITGGSGFIFKGSSPPGQEIRRKQEDANLRRQRRKAWLLKERGDVPAEHVIHPKEADERFDKKYPASSVDAEYDKATESVPKHKRK